MCANCILVVEDERALRGLMERVVSRAGFRVRSAATASEAFAQWNDAGKSIPVVLIDCTLPEGQGGEELARQLAAENPRTRVILMSGGMPAPLEHSGWPGNWVFLPKPFLPSELTR